MDEAILLGRALIALGLTLLMVMLRLDAEKFGTAEYYEATRDGRLSASHVVAGIVIAELVLPADEAGGHVARALAEHISDHGSRTVPAVRSMLEGLAVAAGP